MRSSSILRLLLTQAHREINRRKLRKFSTLKSMRPVVIFDFCKLRKMIADSEVVWTPPFFKQLFTK